jgi:type IV secretory pathway TrbL component
MKKFVALFAFVGCLLLTTACGSDDTDDSSSTNPVLNSAEQIASSAASEIEAGASTAVSSIVAGASEAVGTAQDTAYTEALKAQGADFGSDDEEIDAARTACDELTSGTSLDATRVKIAETTGLEAAQARTLINIAVPIYCPGNVGKLTVN